MADCQNLRRQSLPITVQTEIEIMPDYPEKTCSIDRLVTHEKLVAAALDGSKTEQRRAGVYGYPGETFELEGERFVIKELRQQKLGDMTESDAQREGYPNLELYHAIIQRMHPDTELPDDMMVWVHDFARAD